MAIERFSDYETTQPYKAFQQLPKGGYVLKILNAEVLQNSIGKYVKLSCDIAEGEYTGFYMQEYKNQQGEDKKWHCNFLLNIPNDDGTEKDGWTKRRFKTIINAIEESNSGYHFDWDEQKFKDKIVGGLFNIREYEKKDGTIGSAVNLKSLCSVEAIRSGDYKLPEDNKIARNPSSSDFVSVPAGTADEIPF